MLVKMVKYGRGNEKLLHNCLSQWKNVFIVILEQKNAIVCEGPQKNKL